MDRITHKIQNAERRKHRVRTGITGTAERPRLTVNISNRHIRVQLIDDTAYKTLASVSTVSEKEVKGNLTEKAQWAGSEIAKRAKAVKVRSVVFDRNERLYHGRIKVLAEAARAGGLEF